MDDQSINLPPRKMVPALLHRERTFEYQVSNKTWSDKECERIKKFIHLIQRKD